MPSTPPHLLLSEHEERLRSHRPRTKGLRKKSLQGLALAVAKRADEDYLLEAGGERWLADAESLLAFVDRRQEAEILVRVGEPDQIGGRARTVVTTCAADQPFIVDTLRLCFEQSGYETFTQINAICAVERARTGRLKAIETSDSALPRESLTIFELAPIPSA